MEYAYDQYCSYFYPPKQPVNFDMERLNRPLENVDDQQTIQVDDEGKFK
jgi:hypothetical protein